MQILDKNCSFVPKFVFCTQKYIFDIVKPKNLYWKNKKKLLFALKMKFLPKNFTKMYKFWIKTVVLYPKIYIWYCKTKKFVLFTLKIKFLPKNFTKMCKFWIKTVVLYQNLCFVPKNVHLVPKNQKICTFYSKNEVFAKIFH